MGTPDPGGPRVGILPGEVHLWRVTLSRPTVEEGSWLSPDELQRADVLRSADDRSRFVAGRASLRRVLARHLGTRPEELSFDYGPHGKPYLAGHPLRFNLSHSGDVALLAVGLDVELGVDVEEAPVLLDPEAVVRRSMSRKERRLLDRLPGEMREEAILITWVRKEAVAKGRGEGFALSLERIETQPGAPASGRPVTVRTSPPEEWLLWDVPVGPGRAAALATPTGDISILFFDGSADKVPSPAPLPSIEASTSLIS